MPRKRAQSQSVVAHLFYPPKLWRELPNLPHNMAYVWRTSHLCVASFLHISVLGHLMLPSLACTYRAPRTCQGCETGCRIQCRLSGQVSV